MKYIWILLVFLPIISAEIDENRTVNFTCLGGGKVKLQINTTADDKMNDIFSTDPQNSCSLSKNNFIGNGTTDFPYEMTIDIRVNPCGAKITGDSFTVEFVIKTHEHFFAENDNIYSMECRIENPQVTLYQAKTLDTGLRIVENKMNLLFANSAGISDRKVKQGQKVKLKIEFLPGSHVYGARVTLCYVKNYLLNNSTVFYDNKCPSKSYEDTNLRFLTDKNNPKVIESTEFKAFQLYDQENVKFTCYVEFCKKKNNEYCSATGCVPIGTFMHFYVKTETSVRVISDGTKSANNSHHDFPDKINLFLLLILTCFYYKFNF